MYPLAVALISLFVFVNWPIAMILILKLVGKKDQLPSEQKEGELNGPSIPKNSRGHVVTHTWKWRIELANSVSSAHGHVKDRFTAEETIHCHITKLCVVKLFFPIIHFEHAVWRVEQTLGQANL